MALFGTAGTKAVWLPGGFITILSFLQTMQPLIARRQCGPFHLWWAPGQEEYTPGSSKVVRILCPHPPPALACWLLSSLLPPPSPKSSCTSNHYGHILARTHGKAKGTGAKNSYHQNGPFFMLFNLQRIKGTFTVVVVVGAVSFQKCIELTIMIKTQRNSPTAPNSLGGPLGSHTFQP